MSTSVSSTGFTWRPSPGGSPDGGMESGAGPLEMPKALSEIPNQGQCLQEAVLVCLLIFLMI